LKAWAIFKRPLTRTVTPATAGGSDNAHADEPKHSTLWSAPAERSGDGALDESSEIVIGRSKAVSR